MNYLENVREVLTNPKGFYQTVKKEDTIMKPWLYFVILASIVLFFSLIVSIAQIFTQNSTVDPNLQTLSIGLQVLITSLFTIMGGIIGFFTIFISIAILHLFLMIVGTKKNFVETVKVVCYSYTANLFLIPVFLIFTIMLFTNIEEMITWGVYILLSIIVWGYYLYMIVIGVMQLHELSLINALTAVIFIPLGIILVMIIVVGLIIVLFGFAMFSYLGDMGDITGMVTNMIV